MAELIVRISLGCILVGASLATGEPPATLAAKVALMFCAYSGLDFLLEKRELKNAGTAGFIAVADAMTIAMLLGASGTLSTFGFLVLIPCAYAAARHNSQPAAMAPIAGSSLILSHFWFETGDPSWMLLGQSAGVLAVGLMLARKQAAPPQTEPFVGVVQPLAAEEPSEFLTLRENFRRLKDMYRDLENRTRKDRLALELVETKLPTGVRFANKLAERLHKLLEVEGLVLYQVAQYHSVMTVRSAVGDLPEGLELGGLEFDARAGLALLKDRLGKGIRSLGGEDQVAYSNVILTRKGQVVGMIVLRDRNRIKLSQAEQDGQSISSLVAELLMEEAERVSTERRLREMEAIYEVATVSAGAGSPTAIADRVLNDIFPVLDIDHLGVMWVDDREALAATTCGKPLKLLDSMSFAEGQGVVGWMRTGCPELTLFATAEDSRCNPEETLKRRIGSFIAMPIRVDGKVFGLVTAATHRTGGLDIKEADILRTLTSELGQAIMRLKGVKSEGLNTANEFKALIAAQEGCLVVIEPLKRKVMSEAFGKIALERVYRELARRTASMLPAGGALCRRDHGSLVAFLKGASAYEAEKWAADATASAAMIACQTPDAKLTIPLAVRSRVVLFGKHSDQFSLETAKI